MDVEARQDVAQRLAGGGDDVAVERGAHGQLHALQTLGREDLHGGVDAAAAARDDGLAGAVLVGADHVVVHLVQGSVDGLPVGGDARHLAQVRQVDVGHLAAPRGDRMQRVGEAEHAGGDEGAVFAEAVAGDHVGLDVPLLEKPQDGDVHGQDGGLGELGELQFLVARLLVLRRVRRGPQDVGEFDAVQFIEEHLVGLLERVRHDGVFLGQVAAHVDVLGALAGEQERDLALRGALVDEHTLLEGKFGHRGVRRGLLGQFQLLRDLVKAGRRDADAALGDEARLRGFVEQVPDARTVTGLGEGHRGGQARDGLGGGVAIQDHGLGFQVAGGLHVGLEGARVVHGCGGGGRCLGGRWGASQRARDVLFQHDVEVGAAEAEAAHGGAARVALGAGPVCAARGDGEGALGPLDAWVEGLDLDARRDVAVSEREGGLEHPGGAGGGLEVADVALDGADLDGARCQAGVLDGPERLFDRLQFDRVADRGAGAVGFQVADGGRVAFGVLVGAAHGLHLALGVGGGDALAFAVAAAADAAHDGHDLVAVAFGVREALQDEDGAAFAHDEAVGAGVEGAAAVGAEGTDGAELDVRRDVHGAVAAAPDDHVRVAVAQGVHGGVEGREAAGARGVGGEVLAAQVEGVGDATRHDVAEVAGHGVLRDGHRRGLVALLGARQDGLLLLGGKRLEVGVGLDGGARLGPEQALGGDLVRLAAHGVAEDDGAAVAVERPALVAAQARQVAGVVEGLARGRERPALAGVHLLDHLGGHPEQHAIEGVVGDEGADLGVRLVRGLLRGIVERRIPAFGRNFADAVMARAEVVPEGLHVRRVGQDAAEADDRDGFLADGVHGHRGVSPCFLAGRCSRLLSSGCSAAMSRGRVSRGSMMSSIQPRSAAL